MTPTPNLPAWMPSAGAINLAETASSGNGAILAPLIAIALWSSGLLGAAIFSWRRRLPDTPSPRGEMLPWLARTDQPRPDPQQRRFARPVLATDRDRPTGPHRQRHAIERELVPELLPDLGHLQRAAHRPRCARVTRVARIRGSEQTCGPSPQARAALGRGRARPRRSSSRSAAHTGQPARPATRLRHLG
jgi:hypothetical protein